MAQSSQLQNLMRIGAASFVGPPLNRNRPTLGPGVSDLSFGRTCMPLPNHHRIYLAPLSSHTVFKGFSCPPCIDFLSPISAALMRAVSIFTSQDYISDHLWKASVN
ncbi:hypothetical protein K458DRAFT_395193 [Lentithecium fluviatile CBS 122367]|uniref:Uncharacterized protein n=1 Tax=Lentithecium fluviatile CBS 122367 TaxID=1168545 RepID=A0A6G1IJK0_9PLEO|nr:hypothetical protein K458DRAFT_395193 [Lentithecium fluviatile CBS 122367]